MWPCSRWCQVMMLWDLGFVGHVVELLKWKSIKNFDDSFFFLFWQNEPFRSSFIHRIRFLFMPLSFSLPLSLNALLRSLSLSHARHLPHFSTLSPRLLEFLYANSRFLTFSLSSTPLSRPSRVSFLGYILLQQDQFSFFASEASEPKRPKSLETRIRSSMQTLKLLTSWNLNPKNIFLAGQQKQKKTSTKTGLKSGFPNRPPTKVSVSKKIFFLRFLKTKKNHFRYPKATR